VTRRVWELQDVGMVAVNVDVGVGEATDGVGAVCTWVIRVAWMGVGRW
jgi:hypothetical protein